MGLVYKSGTKGYACECQDALFVYENRFHGGKEAERGSGS